MDGQDWTPVVLRNRKAVASTSALVKAPGEGPIQERKGAAKNMGASFHKLESTETAGTLKRLSNESKQTIIAKRAAAGWNQARLNQECNFPVNTIRDIECGKICPNVQQLNTLNRILKVGLTYEK
jgi:ribosome-binding protein aMBF1 (putative translation factor)